MGIRNYNWLNAQASRRYPLDDNATGTGDDGTRLNDDIIVDLHLRWPKVAGQYAFLGGLTVTDKIVSAVILAADSPTEAENFTPLAAVTVIQPVNEYSYYPLESLYPGAGGFISFGDTNEQFNIRFSTPQQGLISPKTGHPYDAFPIPSMRKLGRVDGLTGLVRLKAGPDLEIVKETVDVDGTEVDALVIRLVGPTSARNPSADYIGPCGKRPESQNCDREGIQTINGVAPDCNGNIEIEFRGMSFATYGGCSEGGTLDQSLGIEDVCTDQGPDRFQGQDQCDPTSDSSVSDSEGDTGGGDSSDSVPAGESSSEAVPCEELPFLDCFDSAIHDSWSLKLGLQRFVATDSPGEPCLIHQMCVEHTSGMSSLSQSNSIILSPWASVSSYSCPVNPNQAVQLYDSSRRNIMIWEDCGTGPSFDKRVTSQVQLRNTVSQKNAGVILNYQLVDPFTNPRINYWVAQINRNTNRVELLRFNGSTLVLENSVAPAVPFSFTDWYEIQAVATQVGANALISVRVENISDPLWPVVMFSLSTSRWGPPEGFFGIHTDRAVADFSYWKLEDA